MSIIKLTNFFQPDITKEDKFEGAPAFLKIQFTKIALLSFHKLYLKN